MPSNRSTEPGFFGRSVPIRWFFIMVGALVVIMVAAIVAVVVVEHNHHAANETAQSQAGAGTQAKSPYDLTESSDADLGAVSKAAFISIMVPNDKGGLTSYGVNADLPVAQALTKAIAKAKLVDKGTAPSSNATTTTATADLTSDSAPTMTFVLASRQTLTFTLDLDQGLVSRQGQTWLPQGDLKTLVEAAIKSPQ